MTSASLLYPAGHPKPGICDNLDRSGGEGGGSGFQNGWTHVYLWPIHTDVWQKPSQYCKVIIFVASR